MSTTPKTTHFVTGFPGFIGKRLVEHLARKCPEGTIYLLVQPKFLEDARRYVKTLSTGATIEILQGDIVDMHLGLSGPEYGRLCDEVTDIFHLAAIYYLGVPKEVARKVNVEGTRNVIELAKDCKQLARLCHFSTAYVSGDRVGVIAEDELDEGQGFRNIYEETKFQAEKLMRRAMKEVPIVILRPSIVVGDSRTGEIDKFDGPYYLGIILVMSPLTMPMPLPGNGIAPLNAVPVDFVVEAAYQLSRDPRAPGRTFHLVDPNPMSSRRVYELIAQKAQKKLPRVAFPARVADALLRLPIIENVARPQRAAISYVNHLAIYNCHHTLELLDGTGIRCPPLVSYLDKLVGFVRAEYKKRREAASAQVEDPLDLPRDVAAGE